MMALTAPKSATRNRLECFALYALLQGVPFYSGVVLMMKLINSSQFAGEPYGVAIFVAATSIVHALVTPWLGPKFPYFFRHNNEPLFADPTQSFSEKVSRWLAQPKTALHLLTSWLLLSVLAVGAASTL